MISALMLVAPAALAAPKLFVNLEYSTDASLDACPGEEEFRGLVSKQLEYEPFRADAERRVVARAERSERGIRGSVRWFDAEGSGRGERELEARDRDCAAFAKTLSFTIAVQIQLMNQELALATPGTTDATPDNAATEPPPPTPPEPAPPRPPPDDVVPVRPPEDDSESSFLLGLGPGAAFGLAPSVTALGRVFGAARFGHLELELAGEATLPSREREGQGRGFTQRVTLASVAGCLGFLDVMSGCAVQKLGAVHVEGFGVDVPKSPTGLFVQSGLRLGVGHRLGAHWFAGLHVDALATLTHWEVTLDGQRSWTQPRFAVIVGGDAAAFFQ
jgi:hypothetical protein